MKCCNPPRRRQPTPPWPLLSLTPTSLSRRRQSHSIVGALDALKSAGGLTDPQQELVEVISGGAALILALVEDTMKAFAKDSSGADKTLKSQLSRVNVREQLIRQSFRIVRLQTRLQQKLWALDPAMVVSPRVPITAKLDMARSLAVFMSLVRTGF